MLPATCGLTVERQPAPFAHTILVDGQNVAR